MMTRRVLSDKVLNPISFFGCRWISSATTSVTKIHRTTYNRVYPTLLVLPNGSTLEIRYHEPRKIIKLPINLALLNENERRKMLEQRKPKEKVRVVEENIISYDPSKYVKKMKPKK